MTRWAVIFTDTDNMIAVRANTAQRDPKFAKQLREANCNAEIGYMKNIQKAAMREQFWRAAAWVVLSPKPALRCGCTFRSLLSSFSAPFYWHPVRCWPMTSRIKQVLRLLPRLGVGLPSRW